MAEFALSAARHACWKLGSPMLVLILKAVRGRKEREDRCVVPFEVIV